MRITLEFDSIIELQRWMSSVKVQPQTIPVARYHQVPLENVELSIRTLNCLRAENLKTVGDVVEYHRENGLLRIPNLGRLSLKELAEAMLGMGIDLSEIDKEREGK